MSVLRERREHGVELLRIDRPSTRNTLDSATLRHLASVLAAALELAHLMARQSNDVVRVLKEMFRDLERTVERIEYDPSRSPTPHPHNTHAASRAADPPRNPVFHLQSPMALARPSVVNRSHS